MKNQNGLLIGFILLIQTLLIGSVLFELRNLTNSLVEALVYTEDPGSVSLAWGSQISGLTLAAFLASLVLSIIVIMIYYPKSDAKKTQKRK